MHRVKVAMVTVAVLLIGFLFPMQASAAPANSVGFIGCSYGTGGPMTR
jgi:hypothetical protein